MAHQNPITYIYIYNIIYNPKTERRHTLRIKKKDLNKKSPHNIKLKWTLYISSFSNSIHPWTLKLPHKALTVFVHSHGEAFLQPTRLALVPMSLVDHAPSGTSLTSVNNNSLSELETGEKIIVKWENEIKEDSK